MDLELTWKLAHQLDWETFKEINDVLEGNSIIGSGASLVDALENKRRIEGLTFEEFSKNFNIQKQAYNCWKRFNNVPKRHLKTASELLNISVDEAIALNLRPKNKKIKI